MHRGHSGEQGTFAGVGLFEDAETSMNLEERIAEAAEYLDRIANLEGDAFKHLSEGGSSARNIVLLMT